MIYPKLIATVIDAVDARAVAEFWRELLGLRYQPGQEPPTDGSPDAAADEWLVLTDADGTARLAVQAVDDLRPPTWPEPDVPQQLHLDLLAETRDDLLEQHDRVRALGGTVLEDRRDDPRESLIVFADPAGHPFCILVPPSGP